MKTLFENKNSKSPEGLSSAERAEMMAIDLRYQMRKRMSMATSREHHRILI